jgi:hypothetical protein
MEEIYMNIIPTPPQRILPGLPVFAVRRYTETGGGRGGGGQVALHNKKEQFFEGCTLLCHSCAVPEV